MWNLCICWGGKAPLILLDGLRTLEYRGYDSAGIAVLPSGIKRAIGGVKKLEKKVPRDLKANIGIAHTRWATHGEPVEKNAHPHSDCKNDIQIVHNGVIENYKILKKELLLKGHTFTSDTDSEVIAHLIEEAFLHAKDFEEAIILSLKQIQGTYGLVILSVHKPETLFVARMGSPIVLGIGKNENFISSDASAILRHTRDVIYLNDGEIAAISSDEYRIFTFDRSKIERKTETLEGLPEELQKGRYSHFMMKEIMEIPEVIINSSRGRIDNEAGVIKFGGIEHLEMQLRDCSRIIIVGCGSAYYVGLLGKCFIEEYSGIPVEVELASEFRYQNPILGVGTIVVAVSQSGETADTLAAVREAKRKGVTTLGIVNVVDSTIARETDAGIYNHAGPEIGVASTKAFISQVEILALFAGYLGERKGTHREKIAQMILGLSMISKEMEKIFNDKENIKNIAEKYKDCSHFLYIGRKYNLPIAYEGALKLKEISYIHAEGYGAGEMKHGPLAMIDEEFPTIAIIPKDSVYEKTITNIEEIRARKGIVIAIATEGDDAIKGLISDVIFIPKTIESLTPLFSTIVLQLFAYYVGVSKGLNVDQPRNLAKAVTVE